MRKVFIPKYLWETINEKINNYHNESTPPTNICRWFKVVMELVKWRLAWSSCLMSLVISLTYNVVHSFFKDDLIIIILFFILNLQLCCLTIAEVDTISSDFSALSLMSLIFVNSSWIAFCASSRACFPSSLTLVWPRTTCRTSSSNLLNYIIQVEINQWPWTILAWTS